MWSHAETPSSSLHFSLSVSHTVLLIKELFPVVSPTLWLVEKRWKSHQCVWDMAFSEGPQGRRSHNKVCSVNVNFCFSVKLCFICQTQSKDRHSSSHTGNRGIFSKRNFFLHAFTQQIFSCIITNTVQVVQPQPNRTHRHQTSLHAKPTTVSDMLLDRQSLCNPKQSEAPLENSTQNCSVVCPAQWRRMISKFLQMLFFLQQLTTSL